MPTGEGDTDVTRMKFFLHLLDNVQEVCVAPHETQVMQKGNIENKPGDFMIVLLRTELFFLNLL